MSVTEMYDCTHGPKKDCHACLIPEMAEALERLTADWEFWGDETVIWGVVDIERSNKSFRAARAVLEKAKLIEDCIPREEAQEAVEPPHRY